jgi:hypothetical protein
MVERETKSLCYACLQQARMAPDTLFEFGGACTRSFPPSERMGTNNLLTYGRPCPYCHMLSSL